eukprot:224389-Alexandrium_andersonii.AAC.1
MATAGPRTSPLLLCHELVLRYAGLPELDSFQPQTVRRRRWLPGPPRAHLPPRWRSAPSPGTAVPAATAPGPRTATARARPARPEEEDIG